MYAKGEVKFEHPAKGPHHCSECMYFVASERGCKLVIGKIEPGDWCDQFKAKGKG